MMQIYLDSLNYVISAPGFWGAMGFTTAIGMFIGAMIFDGELTQVGKGVVSVLSYACMLLWITISRVTDTLNNYNYPYPENVHPDKAFAGTITVVVVTLAWVLGMFLGTLLFNLKYRGNHRG